LLLPKFSPKIHPPASAFSHSCWSGHATISKSLHTSHPLVEQGTLARVARQMEALITE